MFKELTINFNIKERFMKPYLILLIVILTTGYTLAKTTVVDANESGKYLGKVVKVCGQLSQIRDFKKGIYLNINDKFPNQDITFVVWDSSISKIEAEWGGFRELLGKSVCATGLVKTYKDNIQISLDSKYAFEVK